MIQSNERFIFKVPDKENDINECKVKEWFQRIRVEKLPFYVIHEEACILCSGRINIWFYITFFISHSKYLVSFKCDLLHIKKQKAVWLALAAYTHTYMHTHTPQPCW